MVAGGEKRRGERTRPIILLQFEQEHPAPASFTPCMIKTMRVWKMQKKANTIGTNQPTTAKMRASTCIVRKVRAPKWKHHMGTPPLFWGSKWCPWGAMAGRPPLPLERKRAVLLLCGALCFCKPALGEGAEGRRPRDGLMPFRVGSVTTSSPPAGLAPQSPTAEHSTSVGYNHSC